MKKNSILLKKDIVKTFDDRRQQGLSFTVKWEKQFLWAYYSSNNIGWFCRTCEEYSDTGDQYWKTIPQKHDEHPYLFFTEYVKSSKYIQSIKNKQVKQILKKGGIAQQMLKGVENKTRKEKQNNRKLVKKSIKTVYFIVIKKNEQIPLDLQHAPSNATYALTTSAENFLKVNDNFLNDKVIADILVAGYFTVLSNESTDEGESSRMFVYVGFVDSQTHKPVERFLGMV